MKPMIDEPCDCERLCYRHLRSRKCVEFEIALQYEDCGLDEEKRLDERDRARDFNAESRNPWREA